MTVDDWRKEMLKRFRKERWYDPYLRPAFLEAPADVFAELDRYLLAKQEVLGLDITRVVGLVCFRHIPIRCEETQLGLPEPYLVDFIRGQGSAF